MSEPASVITALNFSTIATTMQADQAVLIQQIVAMDPFDEGFDALTDEIEAKMVAINGLLPDLMNYAGSHSGDEAEALWVSVRELCKNFTGIVADLSEKIKLANALRGRGGEG